jgi:flagellar protein FlgJ
MNSSSTISGRSGADSYTDFSALNAIAGLKDKDQALEKIAQQFESMMIRMMMKSMREANKVFEEGNLLSSSEGDMYQDMLDDQLALSLSDGNGMGLAEVMVRQLKQRFGAADGGHSKELKGVAEYLNNSHGVQGIELDDTNKNSTLAANDFVLETQSMALNTSVLEMEAIAPSESLLEMEAIAPSESLLEIEVIAPSESLAEIKTIAPSESLQKPEKIAPHQSVLEAKKINFDGSIAQFVEQIYPMAKRAAAVLGLDPRVLIAQSALETGWGANVTGKNGRSSFNMFNIKADDRWDGDSVKVSTLEYRHGVVIKENASFRAYQSPAESFNDYVNFISNSPRYHQALEAGNSAAYIRGLSDAGYATDPDYAKKVMSIVNSEPLKNAVLQNSAAIVRSRG